MTDHIVKAYDRELGTLGQRIAEMGGIAEQMLSDAMEALGALNVPVRGRDSAAADPAFVPLGAPVWLDVDRREANGLWIAQDTGGAIKGPNRIDSFWGAGDEARLIAGGRRGRGAALLLLPRGALMRIGTAAGSK